MTDVPGIAQVALTPGTNTNFDVVYDPLGNAITQHVLRSDGNLVGVGYPLPVFDQPAVTQLSYLVSNAASSLTELQSMLGQLTGTASSTAALGSVQDAAWTGTGPSTVISALKAVASGSGSGGGSATAANQTAGNVSLATVAGAQGAGGSGIPQPAGGTGILGWISGLYAQALSAATAANQATGNTSLAVIAAASASGATAVAQTTGNTALASIVTNTAAAATAANQTSAITQETLTAVALGGQSDTAWSGTGVTSVIGALKALWVAITGNLTVHLSAAIPTGGNVIGGVTLSGTLPAFTAPPSVTLGAPIPAGTNVMGGVTLSGALPAFASAPTVLTSVPTLAYAGSSSASVLTTSSTLITAGAYTKSLTIATLPASTTNIWLRLDGTAATVGSGFLIKSGGTAVTFGGNDHPMPTANITAITDNASPQTVALSGG